MVYLIWVHTVVWTFVHIENRYKIPKASWARIGLTWSVGPPQDPKKCLYKQWPSNSRILNGTNYKQINLGCENNDVSCLDGSLEHLFSTLNRPYIDHRRALGSSYLGLGTSQRPHGDV